MLIVAAEVTESSRKVKGSVPIIPIILPITLFLFISSKVYADFTVNGATVTFNNVEFRVSGSSGSIKIISGAITCSQARIFLSGNWENSGTFNAGSSTVTFENNLTTSTIIGNTTFYSFVCQTSSKPFVFTVNSTQTVNNNFKLSGAAGQLIKLRSSATGSKWFINFPNSSQSVDYVDVQDSDALTNTVACSNSNNSGNNNANWVFPPNAPSGLTQLAGSETLYSMQWTVSSVIISSFTQSTPNPNNRVKFHLQVSSVTSGSNPDWSQLCVNYTSAFTSQGTTGYQWPALTDTATYWWRVWSENVCGVTSSTSNVLAIDGNIAKLGWERNLSVDIIETSYNFGEVAVGVSTQTNTQIQVKNDGNVTANFSLRCGTNTAGSPWYSIETSSGADNYLLRAVFNSTKPNMTDFSEPDPADSDIVSDNAWRTSGANRYSVDGSGYTGVNVSAGTTKNIWLRFDMPTTSLTSAQQSIILYIRAESP